MIYKNKKAYSMSGFVEGAIGIILVLLTLALVVTSMDHDYGHSHDSSFGISINSTQNDLNNAPGKVTDALQGEVDTTSSNGVSILKSWGLALNGITTVLSFISGSFITNAVNLLGLGQAGTYLGWALRILFIMAMGFVFIKILFRVRP
jgi:hypothetical protein